MPPGSRPLWHYVVAASTVILLGIGILSFQARNGSSLGIISHGAVARNADSDADSPILRVFSALGSNEASLPPLLKGDELEHALYTREDQRRFLIMYGKECSPETSANVVLQRFDTLPEYFATQLWKYCMLYTGEGNIWFDISNLSPLMNLDELLSPHHNVALAIDGPAQLLHDSFLQLAQHHSILAQHMMELLLESSNGVLEKDPFLLPHSLATFVASDLLGEVVLFRSHCQDVVAPTLHNTPNSNYYKGGGLSCPIPGGYCCHVTTSTTGHLPVMALRHQVCAESATTLSTTIDNPYISHIDQVLVPIERKATSQDTPNFFDILLHNDCLPTQKNCVKCMKVQGSCDQCHEACPCYCRALCKIVPPPKQVVKEIHVYPPLYKKDPTRLIPKLVHQTWYEPVTKERYPNMSRLIESFKQSGWEYTFYDDATAAEFLSQHFPPEVREAYDSILPGAFKADLFRYCVLLIKGGVYADMDVLLETNLNEAIASDVGFMTPIDEPGIHVGHRSCLWNGFLAVAPGHPFLARTIEIVVNNIRNRFTSVDYANMLCPNPVLSVLHSVDTLFTCGPCILGAAINQVIGRHMQDEFEIGDVDLWKTQSKEDASPNDPRFLIPGRTIILNQNKQDMGAHRFTWTERNLMVAATDMPDYDDRPPTVVHYSKTHLKFGIYGLTKLYKDSRRANEELRVIVKNMSSLDSKVE
jgi:hypothetical protein